MSHNTTSGNDALQPEGNATSPAAEDPQNSAGSSTENPMRGENSGEDRSEERGDDRRHDKGENSGRRFSIRRAKDAPATLNAAPDELVAAHVTEDLKSVLDGEFVDARSRMRELLATGDFIPRPDFDRESARNHTIGPSEPEFE